MLNNDNYSFNRKLMQAYLNAADTKGVKNNDNTKLLQLSNDTEDEAIFAESDGDIFHVKYDDSKQDYSVSSINMSQAKKLLSAGDYAQYEKIEDEYSDLEGWIKSVSASDNDIALASESETVPVHRDGTGSSLERVEALGSTVEKLPTTQMFKDKNGNISRDKIQAWLDDNGYSSDTTVEGGFNVDDVLAYFSNTKYGEEKLYYHLLANEAWLDKGATGNNKIDGKLSNAEVKNFYFDRFGIDVTDNQTVSISQVEKWREDNKEVGSTLHKDFTYVSLDNFTRSYGQFTYKANDGHTYDDDFDYDYDNDFRYNDRKLNYNSFSTADKISNVLDNLKNAGDYEATIEMKKNVSLKDLNEGKNVILYDGESYDITRITNSYVFLNVDGKEIKVARGSSSSSFEGKCKNAIENLIYSANKTISSNSSNNENDDDYRYNEKVLSYSNFDSSTKISNILDKFVNNQNYEASIEMKKNVSLKNEINGKNVVLYDGETYDITNVTSSYVYLNVDGQRVKVARGNSSSSFENKCRNAIDNMVYSSDKLISSSPSGSSSNGNYSNYSLNNSTAEQVENIMDKIQANGDSTASLSISTKNWFRENGKTLVPVGNYEITVNDDYVKMKDSDGNIYKIPRGTDEYCFEWYCSKENKSSLNKITTDFD